jgi:hypothetical protein
MRPSSLCGWLQDLRGLDVCRASFGALVEPALSASFALAGWRVIVSLLVHRSDLRRVGLLLDQDVGQHLRQSLVLGDARMGHPPLTGIEHPVGQQHALPADLERPVCKGIGLNVLADGAAGVLAVVQTELPALGVDRKVCRPIVS